MTDPAGGPIPTYVITVRLNRWPSDAEIDTLHTRDGGVRVERDGEPEVVRVTRQVETLSVAIAEALDDIATVPGLSVLWVEPAGNAPPVTRSSPG